MDSVFAFADPLVANDGPLYIGRDVSNPGMEGLVAGIDYTAAFLPPKEVRNKSASSRGPCVRKNLNPLIHALTTIAIQRSKAYGVLRLTVWVVCEGQGFESPSPVW
jgi:hypothetical protein